MNTIWIVESYNPYSAPTVRQWQSPGDTKSGGVFVIHAGVKKSIRQQPNTHICRTKEELRAVLIPMLQRHRDRVQDLLTEIDAALAGKCRVFVERVEPWPKVKLQLSELDDGSDDPRAGTRGADADIEAGRVKRFDTMEALIDDLHRPEAPGDVPVAHDDGGLIYLDLRGGSAPRATERPGEAKDG